MFADQTQCCLGNVEPAHPDLPGVRDQRRQQARFIANMWNGQVND